jgi:hypothetical protein
MLYSAFIEITVQKIESNFESDPILKGFVEDMLSNENEN